LEDPLCGLAAGCIATYFDFNEEQKMVRIEQGNFLESRNKKSLTLRKMSKMKKQEILKNQLIQKAQQYFINIASIFEVN
jgi:predicted PhzF superfamily epimerase YddE/YHI9